ncbi:MAG TPA: metalloregulator ArsR/SmtB family transcription factor [Burkholderiales bacterium]|nr:metalloregulator ArsR/SmtB family transcription factor [Burkholderiales bacterium]
MESRQAVDALAALAQASRLAIYRLLVRAGPAGMPAGAIGAGLKVPGATLSFHLAQLSHAGLVRSRQEGRYVIYSADFKHMSALVEFLTENCCAGQGCAPVAAQRSPTKRKASAKA